MRTKIALLMIFVVAMVACESEEACSELTFSGLEKVEALELKNVIEGYYQAEKNELWALTYGYRADDFKKLISKDVYAETMSNENQGYCLKEVVVKEVEYRGDLAVVILEFLEGKSRDVAPVDVSSVRQTEKAVFKRNDAGWEVLAPGMRNHLSLNRRMTFD